MESSMPHMPLWPTVINKLPVKTPARVSSLAHISAEYMAFVNLKIQAIRGMQLRILRIEHRHITRIDYMPQSPFFQRIYEESLFLRGHLRRLEAVLLSYRSELRLMKGHHLLVTNLFNEHSNWLIECLEIIIESEIFGWNNGWDSSNGVTSILEDLEEFYDEDEWLEESLYAVEQIGQEDDSDMMEDSDHDVEEVALRLLHDNYSENNLL